MTICSTLYTKHYYNGASRIASRVGGGFSSHPDLTYDPLNDHTSTELSTGVPLPSGLGYEEKSQTLATPWTRNANCAGLSEQMEFSYSMDVAYQFTNPGPDGERYFYHSDHLGSSAFITSENGYATQFLAYMPYGETLAEEQNSTSYYSPFKFSAKEKDPETGYSYFGARYYSPELSVWLSVDPLSDDYPHQSPYAYCSNNPVMRVDLDGRSDDIVIEGTNNSSITVKTDLIDIKVDASSLGVDFGGKHTIEGQEAVMAALDVVGIFDPTGIADAVSASAYAADGNIGDALISAAGIVPFIGDLGKVGRIGKSIDKLGDAVKTSKSSDIVTHAGQKVDPKTGQKIGPSGKPMVHTVNHPSQKAAKDAARQGGTGTPVKHTQDAKGGNHYHHGSGVQGKGKGTSGYGSKSGKISDNVHHNYPR